MATTEDMLLWMTDLKKIIKHKPCTCPDAKFDMVEILLEGDALSKWKERSGKRATNPQ